MRKLLRADLSRLFRDKLFYIAILFMMGWEGIVISEGYRAIHEFQYQVRLEQYAFNYYQMIGIVFSVFACLYLGREYSDGTIRNKLVVGHGRWSIYFSSLITVTAAGLMLAAGGFLVACAAGIPLLGGFQAGPVEVVRVCVCGAMVIVSYSAIFTLIGMLCSRKAVTAVVSVLTAFILLFLAAMLLQTLSEPEMIEQYATESYSYTVTENADGSDTESAMEEEPQYDENGQRVTLKSEWVKNPYYIRGIQRDIYQFLLEFLPGGQSYLVSGFETENEWRLAGYSALLALLVSGAGYAVFRRKDIK